MQGLKWRSEQWLPRLLGLSCMCRLNAPQMEKHGLLKQSSVIASCQGQKSRNTVYVRTAVRCGANRRSVELHIPNRMGTLQFPIFKGVPLIKLTLSHLHAVHMAHHMHGLAWEKRCTCREQCRVAILTCRVVVRNVNVRLLHVLPARGYGACTIETGTSHTQ